MKRFGYYNGCLRINQFSVNIFKWIFEHTKVLCRNGGSVSMCVCYNDLHKSRIQIMCKSIILVQILL